MLVVAVWLLNALIVPAFVYVEFRDHLRTVRRVPAYTDKGHSVEMGSKIETLVAWRTNDELPTPDLALRIDATSAQLRERLAIVGLLVWLPPVAPDVTKARARAHLAILQERRASGPERTAVYRVAAEMGLRGLLQSLTRSSVVVERPQPHLNMSVGRLDESGRNPTMVTALLASAARGGYGAPELGVTLAISPEGWTARRQRTFLWARSGDAAPNDQLCRPARRTARPLKLRIFLAVRHPG